VGRIRACEHLWKTSGREIRSKKGLRKIPLPHMRIPMKSAPIPKQIGMQSEQIGNPRSRSEATLGFCS